MSGESVSSPFSIGALALKQRMPAVEDRSATIPRRASAMILEALCGKMTENLPFSLCQSSSQFSHLSSHSRESSAAVEAALTVE